MILKTFLATLVILLPSFTRANPCVTLRAALDVGSSTTKMTVARVDSCEQKVLQILAPLAGEKLERAVPYKKNLVTLPDGETTFNAQVMAQGLAALADLKTKALALGAQEITGVATSAFRSLGEHEASKILKTFFEKTGVALSIISQEDEARLGFYGAAIKSGVPLHKLLVWDIGGGSMQISRWDAQSKSIQAYRGQFATEGTQKLILEEILRKGPGAKTPNPLLGHSTDRTRSNPVSRAITKIHRIAHGDLPSHLPQEIALDQPTVIGIGGLHFYSNCEVMKRFTNEGCQYSADELKGQIYRAAQMTDSQLVNAGLSESLEYAPFRVTGAILTYSFMKAAGIHSVRALKVNMSDGVLIENGFWGANSP